MMCKPHETAKWGHAKYTCVHGQLQAEVLCYDAFPVLLIISAWCCMLCPLSHWQDWDLSSGVWHPDPLVSPKCDAQWIGSDLVCLTPAFTEWQRTPITSSVLGMEFMRLEKKKKKVLSLIYWIQGKGTCISAVFSTDEKRKGTPI